MTDINVITRFLKDEEKVAALKAKIATGEPLNEEELFIKQHTEITVSYVSEAWQKFRYKLSDTFKSFYDVCNWYSSDVRASAVLTDRQYHLMHHGNKRVRNKWRNAAGRKYK